MAVPLNGTSQFVSGREFSHPTCVGYYCTHIFDKGVGEVNICVWKTVIFLLLFWSSLTVLVCTRLLSRQQQDGPVYHMTLFVHTVNHGLLKQASVGQYVWMYPNSRFRCTRSKFMLSCGNISLTPQSTCVTWYRECLTGLSLAISPNSTESLIGNFPSPCVVVRMELPSIRIAGIVENSCLAVGIPSLTLYECPLSWIE